MPTKAENGDFSSMHRTLQDPCLSWTDDLPVCPLSGVGFSTNQVYRLDGVRKEEHEFEDRSFHFCLDEDTYFYGVFDGHHGNRAVEFASQRMPAEILLGQLKGRETDQEIKELLLQAFLTVETTFFQSIDNLLAEKENIRLQFQGLRTYEAMQKYPLAVQRLNSITAEIESATSAIVALIHKNKLYIANAGDSCALLGQTDKSGNISICPLSVSHDYQNEDELLRLSQIGVDGERLRSELSNSRQPTTRCIGNYTVKGGYKEYDYFSDASEEPIIAEPEIYGGIDIDDSFQFLLLMSNGLCKSLEQATGTNDANTMMVQIIMEQFAEQSTLTSVAQAAVDKVVRLHHDSFMKNNEFSKNCQKREDITLLVRSFNQLLAHRNFQGVAPELVNNGRKVSEPELTVKVEKSITFRASPEILNDDGENDDDEETSSQNGGEPNANNSDSSGPQSLQESAEDQILDSEGRILPYVDFTDFYAEVEEAYKDGLVPEDWRETPN